MDQAYVLITKRNSPPSREELNGVLFDLIISEFPEYEYCGYSVIPANRKFGGQLAAKWKMQFFDFSDQERMAEFLKNTDYDMVFYKIISRKDKSSDSVEKPDLVTFVTRMHKVTNEEAIELINKVKNRKNPMEINISSEIFTPDREDLSKILPVIVRKIVGDQLSYNGYSIHESSPYVESLSGKLIANFSGDISQSDIERISTELKKYNMHICKNTTLFKS